MTVTANIMTKQQQNAVRKTLAMLQALPQKLLESKCAIHFVNHVGDWVELPDDAIKAHADAGFFCAVHGDFVS